MIDFGDIGQGTRNPLPDEMLRHTVLRNLRRGLPVVKLVPAHDRTMVIAGTGPSLKDIRPEGDVFCLGGAHDWLIDQGKIPCAMVLGDPMPMVAHYVSAPHPDVLYFVTSTSSKFVFENLRNSRVFLWHNEIGIGTADIVPAGQQVIYGGSTIAMRAPFLGHVLGYRRFVFYGVDGSGGYLARNLTLGSPATVTIDGEAWETTTQFAHQARELLKILNIFPARHGWDIEVRGEGLMRHVWEHWKGLQPPSDSRLSRQRQDEHGSGAPVHAVA